MNEYEKIINQLVDARIDANLTQEKLASKLGLKKSNLCRIESGKKNVNFDTILKMIQSYDFHVNLRMDKTDENCEIYVLKQYDFELLTFSFIKEEMEEFKVKIISINENLKHLLPLGMEVSDNGLLQFLKKRSIPKNRTYVEKILQSQNLTINNLKGLIDVCFALSLNDCYWVTKVNFTGRFQDYNLYQNSFSNLLSYLAYTGNGSSHIVITTSPEFTTQGILPKAWRRVDNRLLLYKGSTSGFANSGNECYAEYYASQILDFLGIEHVKYDLEKWKGILASTCENFSNIETSYVPIGRIVKIGGIKAVLEFYKNLSKKAYEFITNMLIFDCIIFNEDRHFGNFGVLINNENNKIIGPAPIFDNGNSLFYYATEKDLEDLEKYSKSRTNPYGITYDELALNVGGENQIKLLQKMENFSFKKHPKYNWSAKRLLATEKVIKERAKELITLLKNRIYNSDYFR